MSDETYNGWANRETWAFWLHVTNDQGWYEMVREYADEKLAEDYHDQESYSDHAFGSDVVEYVTDILDETRLSCLDLLSSTFQEERTLKQARAGLESVTMMRDEIGSWWRIDHAEIGRAARDLASDS